MNRPNFLVIGAARSGSTALFDYLGQHPDVFTTDPKEPHFFAFPGERLGFTGPGDEETINSKAVTDHDTYRALYRGADGARAVGEGSVSYLYYPDAAENIWRWSPDARLICILRNPVDRAYSAFQYTRSRMFEPLSDFREALRREEERIAAGWHHIWHYRRMGYYSAQLRHFYRVFDASQIRVHRFEEFSRDPDSVIRNCYEFLGVDGSFRPRKNPSTVPSGEPRHVAVQRFLVGSSPLKTALKRVLPGDVRRWVSGRARKVNLSKAPADADVRRELLEAYREDIRDLEDLTGRPFSDWLRP